MLPGNLNLVTVTATRLQPGGAGIPQKGYYVFQPSEPLIDTFGNVIFGKQAIRVDLHQGMMSIALIANENDSLTTTNWVWYATPFIDGYAEPRWAFSLPASPNRVNLADLMPVTVGPPRSTQYGVLAESNTNTWLSDQIFEGSVTAVESITLGDTPIEIPPGGTELFLRADGTFAAPPSSTGAVTSVNGEDGDVVLDAASVGAVPTSEVGAHSGVASLDSSGRLTAAQLPTDVIISTTDQIIGGSKTFTDPIVGSITGNAATADTASSATNADHATTADSATSAANATHATTADTATTATSATNASHATTADSATSATTATNATHATTADSATSATSATIAGSATTAGNASTVTTNANLTGDVTSSGNATTVTASTNLLDIIKGVRLDQMSAPTAAVGLSSNKLTGVANGTAAGEAVTFLQLPAGASTSLAGLVQFESTLAHIKPLASTSSLGTSNMVSNSDHVHANTGLVIASIVDMLSLGLLTASPYISGQTVNVTSGNHVVSLCVCTKSVTVNTLGLIVTTAGVTGSGANGMAIWAENGTQLGITGDMTAAISATGPAEGTLTGSVSLVAGTNYYLSVLTHFSGTTPHVMSTGTSSSANIPLINGHYMAIFKTLQTTIPSSFVPSSYSLNSGSYIMYAR